MAFLFRVVYVCFPAPFDSCRRCSRVSLQRQKKLVTSCKSSTALSSAFGRCGMRRLLCCWGPPLTATTVRVVTTHSTGGEISRHFSACEGISALSSPNLSTCQGGILARSPFTATWGPLSFSGSSQKLLRDPTSSHFSSVFLLVFTVLGRPGSCFCYGGCARMARYVMLHAHLLFCRLVCICVACTLFCLYLQLSRRVLTRRTTCCCFLACKGVNSRGVPLDLFTISPECELKSFRLICRSRSGRNGKSRLS